MKSYQKSTCTNAIVRPAIAFCIFVAAVVSAKAQNVAVTDDNGYTAHTSAMLDVKSVTKGFLAPRLTTAQRTAIASPATGLLVFDTSLGAFYYYNGTSWVNLTTGIAGGNFWSYTSPNIYMASSTDFLGLGTNAPLHKLHLFHDVATTDGTDGNFVDIQNNNGSTGVMSGIRFWNGTTANTAKGAIFYQDRLSYGRGDLILANRTLGDQVNVTASDARMIIKSEGNVEVKASSALAGNQAIFHVSNADGDTVFAVYPEGVRVYVADDPGVKAAGNRSGFAVGGFSLSKGLTNEYLRVTPDSVRVYIEDTIGATKAGAGKGGFAVGGFSLSKGLTNEYFTVTDATTQVYVTDSTAGFGVTNIETGTDNLMDLTTQNYLIGHESGESLTNGIYNTFLGYRTGKNTTGGEFLWGFEWEGSNNIFLGYDAGYNNTKGFNNVFIGRNAGYSNDSAFYNTYVGYECGGYSDGSPSNGSYNTFMGCKSGVYNTGGTHNVFFGNCSGWQNTTGSRNVFLGSNSGFHCTLGENNVFIGVRSGFNNYTGSDNTYIGFHSGENSVGSVGNVFVGNYAGQNESGSNKLYIENSSSAAPLIYGEFDSDILTVNGMLGVNTTSPAAHLHVVGSDTLGRIIIAPAETGSEDDSELVLAEDDDNTYNMSLKYDGSTNLLQVYGKSGATIYGPHLTISRNNGDIYMPEVYNNTVGATNRDLYVDNTGLLGYLSSSAKYKDNIEPMEDIGWLYKLRPVNFSYKNDDKKTKQYGLIAEEVEKVNSLFVSYDDEGKPETVSYSQFITPMLKALQEQNKRIAQLEKENRELKKENSYFKTEIENIKTLMQTSAKR